MVPTKAAVEGGQRRRAPQQRREIMEVTLHRRDGAPAVTLWILISNQAQQARLEHKIEGSRPAVGVELISEEQLEFFAAHQRLHVRWVKPPDQKCLMSPCIEMRTLGFLGKTNL